MINNQRRVQKIKLLLLRVPLILTLILLVLQLFELGPFGLPLIILASLTLLGILLTLVLRMHFIEASLKGSTLIIKYYHLFPLIRTYQKAEIQAESLTGYRTRKIIGTLVESLILKVNTVKGIAEFPEIPLTLLNRTERDALKKLVEKCLE